jgi:anti-sigma B factor antagonist
MGFSRASAKIVSLAGRFDRRNIDELRRLLSEASDSHVALIDVSAATYFDAAALSCFVVLRESMAARGGFLAFVAPRPEIEALLEACGPVYRSVFEARLSLARRRVARLRKISLFT